MGGRGGAAPRREGVPRPQDRRLVADAARPLPVQLRGDARTSPGSSSTGRRTARSVEDALDAHDGPSTTAASSRSGACSTSRSPAPSTCCWCPGTGGARPASGRAGRRSSSPRCARRVARGAGSSTGPSRPSGAANPATAEPATAQWPVDPLGARPAAVHEGAELVRAALREPAEARTAGRRGARRAARPLLDLEPPPSPTEDDPEGWAADIDVLLAERAAAARARPRVALPAAAVGQPARRPRRRPRRARRPAAAPGAAAAQPARPPRHRVPRLARAAVLRRPAARPRRAARRRRRGRRRRRRARAELQEAFLASGWAERAGGGGGAVRDRGRGLAVRGRMDAVFADADGGFDGGRLEDRRRCPTTTRCRRWPCSSPRTGWPGRRSPGCPPERVRAAFHYVRADVTLRPADLLDADGLRALLESVPTAARPVS